VRYECAVAGVARARQFRLDLYYRLAIFPIEIPPLREHAEDICPLAAHFLAKLSADSRVPIKYLPAPVLNDLEKAPRGGERDGIAACDGTRVHSGGQRHEAWP
jgi:transcriptional regulator with GAF, ATPase, and Fis domain